MATLEPLSLAVLAIAFLKSAVSSAGSEVGKAAGVRIGEMLFPRADAQGQQSLAAVADGRASPQQEEVATQVVAAEVQRDPVLGQQLQTTINEAVQADPSLADLLPGAAQALFGLSDAQRMAQRSRCPIGGERLWVPPSYFDGQGRALSAFRSFSSYPPSTWAQCRQGHRWAVFAAGGPASGGLVRRLLGR